MRGSKLYTNFLPGFRTCLVQSRQFEVFFTTSRPRCETPVRACRNLNFSTSGSRRKVPPQETPLKARVNRSSLKLPAATLAGTVFILSVYVALGSNKDDDSLNTARFTPFNIISKEQISPTAFILTIRCPDAVKSTNLPKYKAAWEHGLWSVEIKQPQLQIARHYTPLPPLSPADEESGKHRFLIRKIDGGEMSNYLSKLRVGDNVWLRGPHYGFDISKRLGEAKEVVFLAGGTGVAPALQIAHRLLDGSRDGAGDDKPSVRILWANRRSVDSVARDELSGKARKSDGGGCSAESTGDTSKSSLCRQILDLKSKHGEIFSIDYFVDDEKTFIGLENVNAATGKPLTKARDLLAPADQSCRWHSAEVLTVSTHEDDNMRNKEMNCTCPPKGSVYRTGRNLICVSGPDGFIEAYVGPKRWLEGREMQGPVQGLLGSMKRQSKEGIDDWLVLKL